MVRDYGLELDYIALKFLSLTPMHGYMLANKIEKEFGKRPSNGTLNPLFDRLEAKGLIESTETVEHGRYKKIYNLSSKGKEYLKAMTQDLKRFINY